MLRYEFHWETICNELRETGTFWGKFYKEFWEINWTIDLSRIFVKVIQYINQIKTDEKFSYWVFFDGGFMWDWEIGCNINIVTDKLPLARSSRWKMREPLGRPFIKEVNETGNIPTPQFSPQIEPTPVQLGVCYVSGHKVILSWGNINTYLGYSSSQFTEIRQFHHLKRPRTNKLFKNNAVLKNFMRDIEVSEINWREFQRL
jgi:hypothetical protein